MAVDDDNDPVFVLALVSQERPTDPQRIPIFVARPPWDVAPIPIKHRETAIGVDARMHEEVLANANVVPQGAESVQPSLPHRAHYCESECIEVQMFVVCFETEFPRDVSPTIVEPEPAEVCAVIFPMQECMQELLMIARQSDESASPCSRSRRAHEKARPDHHFDRPPTSLLDELPDIGHRQHDGVGLIRSNDGPELVLPQTR
jgi:hypothetical protein